MFTLKAKTISDAWFQLLYAIFDNSYKQNIQKGSFEKEQYRLQYPAVAVEIEMPWLDMVPVIPIGLGILSPTTQEYIEDYFANYLMNPELAENETYKYASRIHEIVDIKTEAYNEYNIYQLEKIISILKETPMTNQACLEIAKPDDIVTCIGNDGKLDPPCLRLIDFKVIPKHSPDYSFCNNEGIPSEICDKRRSVFEQKNTSCLDCEISKTNKFTPANSNTELTLTMSVYFRSWDLWAGFPTNLGGLELLKQYVAQECGLENGKMYAYSAGLHIYGYQEEIVRIRTMKGDK